MTIPIKHLMIIVLALASLVACSGLCGITEISDKVYSPSGEHMLLIFERNCGATSSFQTHVSLMSASDEIPDDARGNLFHMSGHPDWTNVNVYWVDDQHVIISYPSNEKVYRAKKRLHGVNVTYEIRYGG